MSTKNKSNDSDIEISDNNEKNTSPEKNESSEIDINKETAKSVAIADNRNYKKQRSDGVTIIAIYHFLSALPGMIITIVLLAVPIQAILSKVEAGPRLYWAFFGIALALIFITIPTVLALITGCGLLAVKGWARWIAVALAMLSLLVFPIGTIIGGLIIWYLLRDDVRDAFTSGS